MDQPAAKTWKVGTLTYTRGQLIQVFVWLLLGDFVLHLMDNGVVPTLVPLQFQELSGSKTLYNLIAVTAVNLMYTVLVPIVSTWSDRTRTPLGRRRPFLLYTAPLLALVLILLGFSVNIARWLQVQLPNWLGGYEVAAIAIVITSVLFVTFKLLDMFPQSVYYYLWPDVIPNELLGMFGALFRVFYAAGSLFFNYFLIQIAKSHPEEIYIGSAVAYLVAFLLLVWRVKEPAYPPPPAPPALLPGVAPQSWLSRFIGVVAQYFRDCFGHAFYWKYFLAMALFQCAYQPFIANLIFFGQDVLGKTDADLATYGKILVVKDFLWIAIYLCLVPVMTKVHPLRAGLFGYAFMLSCAAGAFVFIQRPWTFGIFTVLTFVAVAIYLGGTAAIGPKLLPLEKYGQFASAGAVVFRLSVALVGVLAGVVFDYLGTRYVYAWLAFFLALGTAMMWLLYLEWKRLGGDESFQPPLSNGGARGVEVAAKP